MTIVSPRRRLLSRAAFHGGLASTVALALADMNLAASATACLAGGAIIAIGSARQPRGGLKKRWRLPLAALAMSVPALLYGHDALSMREQAVIMAESRAEIEDHPQPYMQASLEFKNLYDAEEIRLLASANLEWSDVDLKSLDGQVLGMMSAIGAVLAGDLSVSEARAVGSDWPAASRLVQVIVDRPQEPEQLTVGVLQCWADGKELVAMRPVFQTYRSEDRSHPRYEEIEFNGELVGAVLGLEVPGRYDLSDMGELTPLKLVCEDALQRDL